MIPLKTLMISPDMDSLTPPISNRLGQPLRLLLTMKLRPNERSTFFDVVEVRSIIKFETFDDKFHNAMSTRRYSLECDS